MGRHYGVPAALMPPFVVEKRLSRVSSVPRLNCQTQRCLDAAILLADRFSITVLDFSAHRFIVRSRHHFIIFGGKGELACHRGTCDAAKSTWVR